MTPTTADKVKEIWLKCFDYYCTFGKTDEESFDAWLTTAEGSRLVGELGEEKDNFAISFAVWAMHDQQAQSYQASGATAYKLLELYKDRPYLNTEPQIN